MAETVKKEPVWLHSEQNMLSAEREIATPAPWERQKGEQARWYLRFRIYLALGPKRSLQAAVEAERQVEEAPNSPKNGEEEGAQKKVSPSPTLKLSVPGAWKQASRTWHWVERARAFDLYRQEQKAKFFNAQVGEAEYASRAYRIVKLNKMAKAIEDYLRTKQPWYKTSEFLACVTRLQSIMRDIQHEMDKIDT